MATQNMTEPLVKVIIERDLNMTIEVDMLVMTIVGLVFFLGILGLRYLQSSSRHRFEIDEAEIGVGNQKIKIRPNYTDMQIAYKIWVELSTRKIGLEINLDDDVISEIYDSWYRFFNITRELVREVPITQLRRSDTAKIVRLSIEVLNHGIRPHLTKWQARFRRWYELEITKSENATKSPQEIQKNFPDYDPLKKDMAAVNENLIKYRTKMYHLAMGR